MKAARRSPRSASPCSKGSDNCPPSPARASIAATCCCECPHTGRLTMTTALEGRELTQTGPGTVMGELMRQYWIPALLSSELPRDGDPIRLMLLGERLIAFRDSDGKAGVMDHRCPHRGASLFLGRN